MLQLVMENEKLQIFIQYQRNPINIKEFWLNCENVGEVDTNATLKTARKIKQEANILMYINSQLTSC